MKYRAWHINLRGGSEMICRTDCAREKRLDIVTQIICAKIVAGTFGKEPELISSFKLANDILDVANEMDEADRGHIDKRGEVSG